MNLSEKQKMAQRVSLPLEQKIQMTKERVRQWCEHFDFDVYQAYSGGKDSHVLMHIILSMGAKYQKIPFVFSNTGLEMPEILRHVRKQKSLGYNVIEIKPKKTFDKVWKEYGIPIVSKKVARQIRTLKAGPTGGGHTYKLYDEGITKAGHSAPSWRLAKKWRFLINEDIKTSEQCCDALKKEPIATFEKGSSLKGRGITGMMADEGGYRETMTQCNTFSGGKAKSNPMLFWTEQDVWDYIELYNVEICNVYYDRFYSPNGKMVANASPQEDGVDAYSCVSGSELIRGDGVSWGEYDNGLFMIRGEKRTGCMFCAFGAHLEKGSNRFQRMSVTHPRQHKIVMDRVGMRRPLNLINVKVDFDEQ